MTATHDCYPRLLTMIANLIANYDCCHLMQAAKKKSQPTELDPRGSRTNIVSARQIGRQLGAIALGQTCVRLKISKKSRLVRGLTQRRRGILRKFLLRGVRPLDLELVEQKRSADHAEPHGFRAVIDHRRRSTGDWLADPATEGA